MNPYAGYLSDHDALEVLASTPSRLKQIAENLGEGRISRAPAPGKWSPREIFIHLADCEIAFGFRYRQTLGEENHTVQPFDQDKWSRTYAAYSAEQALATFIVLRNWNLSLLRSLTPEQLDRTVFHPERGEETLNTIVETSAGHDINHLQRLEELVSKPAA